jgi:hypothetical protein
MLQPFVAVGGQGDGIPLGLQVEHERRAQLGVVLHDEQTPLFVRFVHRDTGWVGTRVGQVAQTR